MNINEIYSELINNRDEEYRRFQSKLLPGTDIDSIIGVRVGILRKIAKDMTRNGDSTVFMNSLPHTYYEENILHSLMINEIKDYDNCIYALECFLPFVDNWAVCDTLSPKILKNDTEKLMISITKWIASGHTYTVRFGILCLMRYYMDDRFSLEYADMVSNIASDEYYVKMMKAWYFATALTFHYDETVAYLKLRRLDDWVHNKAIQKAVESLAIPIERKEYLKTLRIKKGDRSLP